VIFVWNAAHVKRTVRKERFSSMWAMDVDVLLELFKVHLTVQLQHAAARTRFLAINLTRFILSKIGYPWHSTIPFQNEAVSE
jgi:hypothetical protein